MRQLGLFITGCMAFLLLMDGCAARPQDPKPAPRTYTFIEPNEFLYLDKEKDPRIKIKLLDSWVPPELRLPPLMPFAYYDYIVAYSSIRDYPQVIVYADRALGSGNEKSIQGGRLEALAARAEAYRGGCSANTFQTPEAYKDAKDAANQGLQNTWRMAKTGGDER